MLEVAAERAAEAGLTNVVSMVMDAQSLDFDASSFDAAICRLGLMDVENLDETLTGVHRVLRRGGRLSLVAPGAPAKNPFNTLPLVVARRVSGLAEHQTIAPHAAGSGDPGGLAGAFRAAGFREVVVLAIATPRRFDSLADALRDQRENYPPLQALMARLSHTEQEAVWSTIEEAFQPFVAPDGFEAPGESLVVAGAA
jgi:SAM-dependent methyltransferase